MISKLDRRRKEILKILAEVPISSTPQLAQLTKVSTETMRKDLDALAEEGAIVKVHGGVALAGGGAGEIPFDLRATKNVEQKRKIAAKAMELIRFDDIIILESCTTNMHLAKSLAANPQLLETLIVITNSFSIVSAFEGGKKTKKMFFLGGWVSPGQYSAAGPQTAKMLREFHANKAFLSGAAIQEEFILTGYHEDDVAFQKAALSSSQKAILMIDSSKFGKTAMLHVSSIDAFDCLITDKVLSEAEHKLLEKAQVHYLKA